MLDLDKPFIVDVKLFFVIIFFQITFSIAKSLIMGQPLIEEGDFEALTINGMFALLILAPIVEEFVFRGIFAFIKNKWALVFYIPLSVFLILTALTKISFNFIPYFNWGLIIILGLVTFLFYREIVGFFFENRLLMIVITALLFSIVHIYNYQVIDLGAYLGLIPRFVGGLFLGYVALKYGLLTSIGFHFLNNLIVVFIAFIQKQFFWP